MKRLRKCTVCREYTMKAEHCSAPTVTAYPPKFSPQDKYAEYRQKARSEQNEGD
jgi:H/ACA ribonucleoprotein complex subunit 3